MDLVAQVPACVWVGTQPRCGAGPGSPLDKLCAWGGRILRLGASPDTTTALHYAEYLARIPNKRTTRWDYLLATPEGSKHVWNDIVQFGARWMEQNFVRKSVNR